MNDVQEFVTSQTELVLGMAGVEARRRPREEPELALILEGSALGHLEHTVPLS